MVVMVHPDMVEKVRFLLHPCFAKVTHFSFPQNVRRLLKSSAQDSMVLEHASIVHTLVTLTPFNVRPDRPPPGISHRDPSYDRYMNSQECLVGPGTDFLASYRLLLRADLDTFPTPRFRGLWPQGVYVSKEYYTNFNLRSIKYALKKVACDAGLEHRGWYNPGSTWYGDAGRVRQLARLTVALNKFGRASLFGPGTPCRCCWSSYPPLPPGVLSAQ